MKYVFYGFDERFPNAKKEITVNAQSLHEAKTIMTKISPNFVASCIYPELNNEHNKAQKA